MTESWNSRFAAHAFRPASFADQRLYEAKEAGRNRVVGPHGAVPQGTMKAAFTRPTKEYGVIPLENE